MTLKYLFLTLPFSLFVIGEGIPGAEEFPLTQDDILVAETAITPAVSVQSKNINQTCLLTQEDVPTNSSLCTWRIERECFINPEKRKIPIYDDGCKVDHKGVHSRNCKEILRPQPVYNTVKVCNSSSIPECPEPCPECETHCKIFTSSWSKTSHVIET